MDAMRLSQEITTEVNIKLVVYFSSLIPPYVVIYELPGEPWAQTAYCRMHAIVTCSLSCVSSCCSCRDR